MSGKTRSFSVSAFRPIARPYNITAHSKGQLVRRLAEALKVEQLAVRDVADALWKGCPVFMTDCGMAILPGRFGVISYQVLEPSASLF